MKTVLIFTLSLSAILVASFGSKDGDYFDSDNIISEFRDVTDINKVYREKTFTISILQGPDQSIKVLTNDNIIHKIDPIVLNNKLKTNSFDLNFIKKDVEVNFGVANLN